MKAVVAQSFERIHRSNLVGMGVLPLQFKEGATAADAQARRLRDLRRPRPGPFPEAPAGHHAAGHPEGRQNARRSGPLPDRHPHRDRILPARRHTPLRPPANPREDVISETTKPVYLVDAYSDPVVDPHRGQGELPEQRMPARLHDADDQVGEESASSSISCGARAWTARSSVSSPGSLSNCARRRRRAASSWPGWASATSSSSATWGSTSC